GVGTDQCGVSTEGRVALSDRVPADHGVATGGRIARQDNAMDRGVRARDRIARDDRLAANQRVRPDECIAPSEAVAHDAVALKLRNAPGRRVTTGGYGIRVRLRRGD